MDFLNLLISVLYWYLNTFVRYLFCCFHILFSFLTFYDIAETIYISYFFLFFNYFILSEKVNNVRIIECGPEDRNAHVVNVITPLVLTIYRAWLKKFTDFQSVARTLHRVEKVSSESRYYRVTRRPHATLSVLIYKRMIDVTQFMWQYSRNCRKNVTITRNLCYLFYAAIFTFCRAAYYSLRRTRYLRSLLCARA